MQTPGHLPYAVNPPLSLVTTSQAARLKAAIVSNTTLECR